MLMDNEILVKDMELKELKDNGLYDVIKSYQEQYKKSKTKNKLIIYIELILLFIFTILDFCKINVTLFLMILCIALFIQYLKWGFSKLINMYQHYDITMFFKDIKDGLTYEEVICDDIVSDRNNGYVALISTLDGINVMEKIRVPYVENMKIDFDRKDEKSKPHMYLIKSGVVYFAIESIDDKWWSKNIQKILK